MEFLPDQGDADEPPEWPSQNQPVTDRQSSQMLTVTHQHHRDRTVHQGVRTTQHSLANCVTCHASKETGRVTGSKDAFCEGCHRYAAVKLDCFECHADRPKPAVAAGTR